MFTNYNLPVTSHHVFRQVKELRSTKGAATTAAPPPQKHRKTKKQMICSPAVAGKTIREDTCMTNDVIKKIKSEYNHTHRNNPIKAKTPKVIWEQLRDRLTNCSQEECWLQQIKDPILRGKIKEYIFAPKYPKEWKYNPNEWLSNYDIFNVLTQWEDTYPEFEFIGPTFIDFDAPMNRTGREQSDSCVERELCKFSLEEQIRGGRKKVAIVFNLDKHTQSGSHWVSLWVDIEDKFIFYFDSAGNKIPAEITRLVERIQKQGLELGTDKSSLMRPIKFRFYENYPMTHQYGNTECGMYSLFFIITMLTGNIHHSDSTGKNTRKKHRSPRPRPRLTWQKKVDFFRKKRIPDKYVENLRWKYFNAF